MLSDRIEGKWIDTFVQALTLCKVEPGDDVAILSETQSRQLNVHLTELALLRLGARPFHVVVPRHQPARRCLSAPPAHRTAFADWSPPSQP